MVHFVGAGPGAPDLITRRGAALLQKHGGARGELAQLKTARGRIQDQRVHTLAAIHVKAAGAGLDCDLVILRVHAHQHPALAHHIRRRRHIGHGHTRKGSVFCLLRLGQLGSQIPRVIRGR